MELGLYTFASLLNGHDNGQLRDLLDIIQYDSEILINALINDDDYTKERVDLVFDQSLDFPELDLSFQGYNCNTPSQLCGPGTPGAESTTYACSEENT